MSVAEKRSELIQLIEGANEAFIEAAHLLLAGRSVSDADPVLGYDLNGTPRTASELTNILDNEVKAVENGDYLTIEEFQKKSAEWETIK